MIALGLSSTQRTWLTALLLMLAEFLVFDRMTSRHHAHFFPRWTDQTQYLAEAYAGYEDLRAHGLWHALRATLTNQAAQGTLHDVLAVMAFWLVGSPSRSAALSLNMLAFLAWQAALLAAVPRVSGSRPLGWIGFGILLCLAGPWTVDAGSAVDFRLDHGAMCLVGVTAACALLTAGFRSLGWSVVFGVAAGVTVIGRFLTGAYFAPIFLVCTIWILLGDSRRLRLRNLLAAGIAAAVPFVLTVWPNRFSIYNYYWVGHVTSVEADARASGLNPWGALEFIVSHVGREQLGLCFGGTAAALIALLLVAGHLKPRRPPPAADGNWLFFGLVFLLVPAAVLCADRQKSPFVLGVLVPGVVLLLLWLWAWLLRRIDFDASNPILRLIPAGLAVVAVAAGGQYFLRRQLAQPYDQQFLADARKVNQLADYLDATASAAGLASPRIGADQLLDFLDGRTMSVLCYERHGTWRWFTVALPVGVAAQTDDFIFERLQQCDFFLLTDEMSGRGYYPYDQQMRRLHPIVKTWCEEHLRRVETFPLFGRTLSLYQRRGLP